MQRTQSAGQQRSDHRAPADKIVYLGHNKGDADKHQRGGIYDIQHRRGHGHDAIQSQVGHHSAEHADRRHEHLVAHLAPAQLGEIRRCGAGQRDGRGDAGQTHHHAEDDHAGLAHQSLHDGHDQCGAANGAGVLRGHGSAQIGQTHIHRQQQHARQQRGAAHHAELASSLLIALGGDALQNNDAEGQRRQRVHGLVARLDAGDGHVADLRQGGDLAQRGHDALDDDGEQSHQQQRREHLAHDVHHGGLLQAQHKDQRKKCHGEHHRRHAAEVGGDGHFVGAGAGAGDGHHGADAQHDGAHKDLGGELARAPQHLLAAAHAQQGKHAHHGKADVRDEVRGKALQPAAASLHAQKGREDHIARAEKHGKQRKAHYDNLAEGVFLLSVHYGFSISLLFRPRPVRGAQRAVRDAFPAYRVSFFSSLRK